MFSREDVAAYETKPQVQVENHDPFNPTTQPVVQKTETTPQVNAEADVDAAIAASLTDSDVTETNDGSTTETQAEPVAAEIANPEGAKDPNELENPSDGGHRSRAQERIEELVAERNALRKYGEYLLSQVEGQRKAPEQAAPQPATVPATKEEKAPTLEDAGFDPVKHSVMQNEYISKQIKKGIQEASAQIETRQTAQAARAAFEGRVAEFSKTASDFQVVVGNPSLPQLAPLAAEVIVKASDGPAVLYHLGKNPDVAAKIARMGAAEQLNAIGRLQERLSQVASKEPSKVAPPVVKPASVTKAPPPPKPVPTGSGVIEKTIMDMNEFVANERNKKIQERTAKQKMRQAYGR
jgi:hypothetical protein